MRIAGHALGLVALSVHSGAFAHDLWLEREAGSYVLYHGHRHSGHAGDEVIPYAPAFVHDVVCLAPDGTRNALPAVTEYPARFEAECAAVLVSASSGAWTTTSQGTQNLPPLGLDGVVRSWRSFESVKRIDGWAEGVAQSLGDGLEVVPLVDPFVLGRRDKLRLLVTLGGEPQRGVTVAYAGEPRGVTGADGRINLRLRAAGMQLISASISVPAAEPGIAQSVHATALQFEIGTATR